MIAMELAKRTMTSKTRVSFVEPEVISGAVGILETGGILETEGSFKSTGF